MTKKALKTLRDSLLYSILAGIMIGIGGTVNLSCENKVVGASLFAVGLLTIVIFQFFLYTGKVGYAKGWRYIPALVIIWIGNFLGAGFCGIVLKFTKIGPALIEKAMILCNNKLSDSPTSVFVLGLFCGLLMYIAVDGYKKRTTNETAQLVIIFVAVMVFILSGYEHCVANMYYFTIGEAWSAQAVIHLLVTTAGNSVGGLLIPLVEHITKRDK